MNKPLFFLSTIVLLIALIFPSLVRAVVLSDPPYNPIHVVEGEERLTANHGAYQFEGLTIAPSGTLIIDPGVHIILTAEAGVRVEGTLLALGTAEQPIFFEGQPSSWWASLTALSSSPQTSLRYVEFHRFRQAIKIYTEHRELDHLRFLDGESNILEVGHPQKTYGDLHLQDIVFENHLAGKRMQAEGLRVHGTYHIILLEGVKIQDNRAPEQLDWSSIGVEVKGNYYQLSAFATQLPGGCEPVSSERANRRLLWISSEASKCPSQTLPLVFVPGFGASINLPVLSKKPGEKGDLEGWHFINSLTPAYRTFLDQLDTYKIPYEIAYYDWRLPAGQNAQQYLKPALERAKARFKTQAVNLVAHSFGGLVARSYIQSSLYPGDVRQFIELGTPNQGAAKAYSVWEGGVLPEDWKNMRYLFRYYRHRFEQKDTSDRDIIHAYFPSVREVLPIYPALYTAEGPKDPEHLRERNDFLLQLKKNIRRLTDRIDLTVMESTSENTPTRIELDTSTQSKDQNWPDGKPKDVQPVLKKEGDGTTPLVSAHIPKAHTIQMKGEHSVLPAIGTLDVVHTLYPDNKNIILADVPAYPEMLSFFFDCPVAVTITLPDGKKRSSLTPNTDTQAVGEVEVSPDLLWMVLPKQVGTYTISVEALADTEVRQWVEDGPIQTFTLQKGEIKQTTYGQEPSQDPTPAESKPTMLPIVSTFPPPPSNTPPSPAVPNLPMAEKVPETAAIVEMPAPFQPFEALHQTLQKLAISGNEEVVVSLDQGKNSPVPVAPHEQLISQKKAPKRRLVLLLFGVLVFLGGLIIILRKPLHCFLVRNMRL